MPTMSRKYGDSPRGGYPVSAAHRGFSHSHAMGLFIIFVVSLLITSGASTAAAGQENSRSTLQKPSTSILPIALFDSDVGFGFGVKGVFKNRLDRRESWDVLIFLSTRGEQSYAVGFSIPDNEIRQGTLYPIAVDFKIEYDKLLKSNYFGIGNRSQNNDHQFPREKFDISLITSRALSKRWLTGAGLRFVNYSVYDYDTSWQTISDNVPGTGQTAFLAFLSSLRHDTRNSCINPTAGHKAEIILEWAFYSFEDNWDYLKVKLELGRYSRIFGARDILAYRLWIQHVNGVTPYQELSKIGDSWTARGYKAERFLDRSMALISAEYRFPLYRILGGVLFIDSGRVWPCPQKMNAVNWHSDSGAGLRLYLENFVTRLDIGHSPEGTRLYLNFGQVF